MCRSHNPHRQTATAAGPGQAQLAHQPLHRAPGHRGAFAIQRQPYLLGPVYDHALEPLDLGVLLAGHPRTVPGAVLGLAVPLAQHLRRPDARLGRHRADRRPHRRVLRPRLRDHRTARTRNSGG